MPALPVFKRGSPHEAQTPECRLVWAGLGPQGFQGVGAMQCTPFVTGWVARGGGGGTNMGGGGEEKK